MSLIEIPAWLFWPVVVVIVVANSISMGVHLRNLLDARRRARLSRVSKGATK